MAESKKNEQADQGKSLEYKGAENLPATLTESLDLTSWANALVNRTPYEEPDPDYLSRMLIMQTLMAATPDEVLNQNGVRKLQESIPNVPGGGTGPIEITDLYVTSSDFGEGAPCYIIFEATDLETGFKAKYSTGAQQLQAQILSMLKFGQWPIKCNIKRTERKDKGGRFLFWMYPAD